MEALPPELKIEVMQRLDDLSSLSALIHSIPSFFNIFNKAKATILLSVLRSAIPPAVMHDALTAQKSSKLTAPSLENARQILEEYKHRLEEKLSRAPLEPSLPLSSYEELARTHKLIEWFTRDLCCSTFSMYPLTPQEGVQEPVPVSTDEIVRIHRALYRFQLFCNLFGSNLPPRLDMFDASTLLALWPAWEVEELNCIHNYLSRRLSDVIDEVAEHDVKMGESYGNVAFDRLYLNETKEYLLSLGLRFLLTLLALPTYEERRQILSNHQNSYSNFLGNMLELRFFNDANGSDDDAAEIAPVSKSDDDLTPGQGQGPNEAWSWAYRSGSSPGCCAPNRLDLREWCYCIWDKRRLSALDLLATPWSETRFIEWNKVVEQECDRRYKENARSLRERSDIMILGGSGYWTDDRSQIVWPPGRKPSRRRKIPVEYQYIANWRRRKG